MKQLILAAAAVVALTGCKIVAQTDIYTSDVLAVVENGETMTTPMVMSFEVAGADGCAKAESLILGPLETAFGGAEYIGCAKRDFDTFADFRLPVDLVFEVTNGASDSDQPIYIGGNIDEGGDLIRIDYYVNQTAMDAFMASIPEELTRYQSGTPDFELSATISNDLRSDIKIEVNDVFADGQPIQKSKVFDLPRRGEVKIDLSNVSNAALGRTDWWVLIAKIPVTPQ